MSQRDRIVELIIERGSKLWGKDPSELSENTRFTEDVNAIHRILLVVVHYYNAEIRSSLKNT